MMIDIHSHCLPEIDDGAKNTKESIAMLSDSYNQGVRVCVATPHFEPRYKNDIEVFCENRQKSFELLQSEMQKSGVDLPKLLIGAEVYLFKDISDHADLERLCISGTKYMLIELSTKKYSPKYSEWLYSLSLKKIVPVLAHVERYPYLSLLLEDLSDVEIVCQINAQTVLKRRGRRLLKQLIGNGYDVVVASDMHNMGLRRNRMKDAYQAVSLHMSGIEDEIFRKKQKEIINN